MYRVLLTFVTVVFLLSASTLALDPKPHPLYGNKILGQSAEIAVIWPSAIYGKTCSMRVYDLDSLTLDSAAVHEFLIADSTNKHQGITTGDFDGDGYDDILAAYTWQEFGHFRGITVIEANIDTISLGISSIDSMGICCTKYLWNPSWEQTNLRLFSGNFDADFADEAAMIYYDSSDAGQWIRIRVWDRLEGGGWVEIGNMGVDSLEAVLGEQMVFDAASGDFDGDGIDEIIAGGIENYSGSNHRVYLKTYKSIHEENRFELTSTNNTTWSYAPAINQPGDGHWIDRLVLATGDFNGNALDEFALTCSMVRAWWIWGFVSNYHLATTSYLYTFRVSPDLDSIIQEDHVSYNQGDEVTDHCSGAAYYHPYRSGRALGLAAGDLNLDGNDDIVWGIKGEGRIYRVSDSLKLTYDNTIYITNRWNEPCRDYIKIADMNVDPADSLWLPEVIVGDWGGASGHYRIRVFNIEYDTTGEFTDVIERARIEETHGAMNIATAVGDFDGDGVRLGEPVPYSVDEVRQPSVILKAPPVHYDIFGTDTFDISGCMGDLCEFSAAYSTVATTGYELQTEFKTDWGLGAHISCSTGFMGASVEANFSINYGSNFSKIEGNSHSEVLSELISVSGDDLLMFSSGHYDIWEYPVYWKINGVSYSDYITIVKPAEWNYGWKSTKDAYYMDNMLMPGNECMNILSYPPYQNEAEFAGDPKVAQVIKVFSSYQVPTSDIHKIDSLRFEDFSSTEVEEEWNIDIEVGLDIGYNGVEVGVEGSYGRGEVSTHTARVGEKLAINFELDNYNQAVAEAPYIITPCIYRASNGALVLDYGVMPVYNGTTDNWWDIMYKPNTDPAFCLPWRFDNPSDAAKKMLTPDLVFSPRRPGIGDTVSISCQLHNYSLKELTQEFSLCFYRGDPATGGTIITGVAGDTELVISDAISIRGNMTVDFQWEIPGDILQKNRIYAVIDGDDAVVEVHENNNKGWNLLFVPEGMIVDIEDENLPPLIPESFGLHANYPNPFNPITTIGYSLPHRADVELAVYNILGRKVTTLVDEDMPAGYHSVQWDGTDVKGCEVSSGIYFYRIKAGDYAESKKMLLLK